MKKVLQIIQAILAAYVLVAFVLGFYVNVPMIPDVKGTAPGIVVAIIALSVAVLIDAIAEFGCCETKK